MDKSQQTVKAGMIYKSALRGVTHQISPKPAPPLITTQPVAKLSRVLAARVGPEGKPHLTDGLSIERHGKNVMMVAQNGNVDQVARKCFRNLSGPVLVHVTPDFAVRQKAHIGVQIPDPPAAKAQEMKRFRLP